MQFQILDLLQILLDIQVNKRKIAVLTTSDIQSLSRKNKDDEVISIASSGEKFYSTGILGKAITQRYKVIVVTTRQRLGNHDKWWIQLVGRKNIHYRFFKGGGYNDEGAIKKWKKLYLQLGLDETKIPNYSEQKIGWCDYHRSLPKFGIMIGRNFANFD